MRVEFSTSKLLAGLRPQYRGYKYSKSDCWLEPMPPEDLQAKGPFEAPARQFLTNRYSVAARLRAAVPMPFVKSGWRAVHRTESAFGGSAPEGVAPPRRCARSQNSLLPSGPYPSCDLGVLWICGQWDGTEASPAPMPPPRCEYRE
jgi:hypothetical protein